jgi:hypothetical protein
MEVWARSSYATTNVTSITTTLLVHMALINHSSGQVTLAENDMSYNILVNYYSLVSIVSSQSATKDLIKLELQKPNI